MEIFCRVALPPAERIAVNGRHPTWRCDSDATLTRRIGPPCAAVPQPGHSTKLACSGSAPMTQSRLFPPLQLFWIVILSLILIYEALSVAPQPHCGGWTLTESRGGAGRGRASAAGSPHRTRYTNPIVISGRDVSRCKVTGRARPMAGTMARSVGGHCIAAEPRQILVLAHRKKRGL